MISHAIQFKSASRLHLHICLLVVLMAIAGSGLMFRILASSRTAAAARPMQVGDQPNTGETCFATLDNGSTIFSSTNASAVQQAVDAAHVGAVVKVAGYCAGVNGRTGVTQTVYLSQSLTIQGGYTNTDWIHSYPITQPTTLDALAGGRVLYLTGDMSATIEGLRITGGNAHGLGGGPAGADAGGGIYMGALSATLFNSQLFENTAGDGVDGGSYGSGGNGGLGGAIYNRGTLVLGTSVLSGNAAGNGSSGSYASGAGGDGGAIYNIGSVSVVSSTISGNHAGYGGLGGPAPIQNEGGSGGGIFNTGTLLVLSSTVADNHAEDGGSGGGIYSAGTTTVISSLVNGNSAGDGPYVYHFGTDGGSGGGIFSVGQLTVRDSTFTDNITGKGTSDIMSGGAGGDGGGLASNGLLMVSGTVFRANVAAANAPPILYGSPVEGSRGGAIAALSGSAMLTNTLVADNQADSYGSGVILAGAWSQLWHTTIAHNTGGDRIGVFVGGTAAFTNSVVVSQAVGVTVTAGHTATLNGVLWYGNLGINIGGPGTRVVAHQYAGFPGFVNPDAGDYHLAAGSSAINRGVAAGVKIDLDGQLRDPAPDLGAYEYHFAWNFYLPVMIRNSP